MRLALDQRHGVAIHAQATSHKPPSPVTSHLSRGSLCCIPLCLFCSTATAIFHRPEIIMHQRKRHMIIFKKTGRSESSLLVLAGHGGIVSATSPTAARVGVVHRMCATFFAGALLAASSAFHQPRHASRPAAAPPFSCGREQLQTLAQPPSTSNHISLSLAPTTTADIQLVQTTVTPICNRSIILPHHVRHNSHPRRYVVTPLTRKSANPRSFPHSRMRWQKPQNADSQQ